MSKTEKSGVKSTSEPKQSALEKSTVKPTPEKRGLSEPSLLPAKTADPKQHLDINYIVRDRIIPAISNADMFKLGLQLDSDVYKYTGTGAITKEPVIKFRHRFLSNSSFADLLSLNLYLRNNGKIPQFLEVKESPGKGYGIFAKKEIPALTFLGFYEGIYRPPIYSDYINNPYIFNINGFDKTEIHKPFACVDAGNITFSNWTRFVNDGKVANIEFIPYNCQIYTFTMPGKSIASGEELIVHYGETYWKLYDPDGKFKKD